MGKADDPDCANPVPFNEGDEIEILQPVVDRIRVKRLPGNLFLVSHIPGPAAAESNTFVVDLEDFNKIREAPDPTVAAINNNEIKRYRQYPSSIECVFTDTLVYDLYEQDPGALNVEDLTAVEIDPSRLYRIHTTWSFDFYPLGSRHPRSRVEEVELWGTEIHLDKAVQRLSGHPWVLGAEIIRNPVSENWSLVGERLMKVRVLLPQEVRDEYSEALYGIDDPHSFSASDIANLIGQYFTDEKLPAHLRDPFGVADLRISNPEDSPDYEASSENEESSGG